MRGPCQAARQGLARCGMPTTSLLGFPWRRGAEAAQTQAANEVYSAAIELLFVAFSMGAVVTIENPTRSWSS